MLYGVETNSILQLNVLILSINMLYVVILFCFNMNICTNIEIGYSSYGSRRRFGELGRSATKLEKLRIAMHLFRKRVQWRVDPNGDQ